MDNIVDKTALDKTALDKTALERLHSLQPTIIVGYEYRWVYETHGPIVKWTPWQPIPCTAEGRLIIANVRAQILEGFKAQIRYLSATSIEGYGLPND